MYHFIINPNASAGLAKEIWEHLQNILDEKLIEYKYYLTTFSKNATDISNEITLNIDSPITIAVIGGDGTLNEVINGLNNIHLITLGVVPIGSGNDFVRSFGYKASHEDYLNIILNPNTILKYDLSQVTNENGKRKFIVSSGIGFDATITYIVNNSNFRKIFKNTPISKLVYIFAAIKSLIIYKPLKFKLYEEDKISTFNNGYFCIVMNTPYEGKAVKFCPDAKGYDGVLDFCMIDTKSRLKVIFLILRGYFGKHVTNKSVYISRGKKFKVEASDNTHCHTDGEQIGVGNWTEYEILDEKINIIVN